MIFDTLDKQVEYRCREKYGVYGPFSPVTALERLTIVKENPAIFGLSKKTNILFIFMHKDGDYELFIYFRKNGTIRSWTVHKHIYTKELEQIRELEQIKELEQIRYDW